MTPDAGYLSMLAETDPVTIITEIPGVYLRTVGEEDPTSTAVAAMESHGRHIAYIGKPVSSYADDPSPRIGRFDVTAIINEGGRNIRMHLGPLALGAVLGEDGTLAGFLCERSTSDLFEENMRAAEARTKSAAGFSGFEMDGDYVIGVIATQPETDEDCLPILDLHDRAAAEGKTALLAIGPDAGGRYALQETSDGFVRTLPIWPSRINGSILHIGALNAALLIDLAAERRRSPDGEPAEPAGDTAGPSRALVEVAITIPTMCAQTRGPGLADDEACRAYASASRRFMDDEGAVTAIIAGAAPESTAERPAILVAFANKLVDKVRFRRLPIPCADVVTDADGRVLSLRCDATVAHRVSEIVAEITGAIASENAAEAEKPCEVAIEPEVNLLSTGPWPTDPANQTALIAAAMDIAAATGTGTIVACGPGPDGLFDLRAVAGWKSTELTVRAQSVAQGHVALPFRDAVDLKRALRPLRSRRAKARNLH